MYFTDRMAGRRLVVGQEVKLGHRWRTILEFTGEPDDEDEVRVFLARDVRGRERMCKVLADERYPVRRGTVPEAERFGFYESTNVTSRDFGHRGRVLVTDDDGGPVVKVRWVADSFGRDIPFSQQREQRIDRELLGDSLGYYRARGLS